MAIYNIFIVLVLIFMLIVVGGQRHDAKSITTFHGQKPIGGNVAVDEVVVESSLYIKPKQRSQLRRFRRAMASGLATNILSLDQKTAKTNTR